MKFYDSIGPNPRVVRMAAAETGVALDTVTIDIMAGENRSSDYAKKVPTGGTPALALDSGLVLSEVTALSEYLDEIGSGPSIIGTTPEERAETRMWVRRIDLGFAEPMANGFRAAEGRQMFASRMTLMDPEGAAQLKAMAREKLLWLDGLMAGRHWVCGDRFTLADILLFCFVEFGGQVGQPLPAEATWTAAWLDRVRERPSAKA